MLRKPLGVTKNSFFLRRCARRRVVVVNSTTHDMTLILQAECGDATLSSTSLTTSAEIVQQSSAALLNNVNRPIYVSFLLLLHRLGAIEGRRTRQEIARFLVPSVHFDSLPWLWSDGVVDATSLMEQRCEGWGDLVASLRTLPPPVWRTAVEQGKPYAPGEQLHYWHQVMFAVSVNPAFGEAGTFDAAHRELLGLLCDYYSDIVHIQQFFRSKYEGTVVTRMPPVLVRKLRKFYVEHYRLLLYAELFRVIVEGEERVVPLDCTTALLNDAEVFEYYLTIPGRRESGLGRDVRWARTLEYAAFAFQKLFRQQQWQGIVIGTALARPVLLFMNACVFARNDNAEGERYREAILAVMRVFYAEHESDIDSSGGTCSECDVLRVLRDTGVECMLAKCKRLHFGPMRGLLDVCTVAVMTELLLCTREDAKNMAYKTNFCRNELEILFSPRKLIGEEMYYAAKERSADNNNCNNHYNSAAYYGLMNLGKRIEAALQSVVQCPASLQRYTNELEKWEALIGRPLRLTFCDVFSRQKLLPLAEGTNKDPAVSLWRCGCNSLNVVKSGSVACIDCVSRTFVRHSWCCPHCLWVSKSGDRVDFCLSCRRSHPFCTLVENDSKDNDGNNNNVATPVLDVVSVTSFFWCCEVCLSYSLLACDDDAGTLRGCAECGAVGRGWSTGYFVWRCGCGEINSPSQRWCRSCSLKNSYACCVCVACRKVWELQPCRTAAGRDVCPSCNEVHPRDIAAWQRRVLRCPFCYSLTPSSVEVCQNCQRHRGVLGQFLACLSDWPWSCHTCGHRHHHRLSNGRFHSSTPDVAAEACAKCGVLRPDPVLFDMHEAWFCSDCRGSLTRGFSCQLCLALHPAIPATEVHAWRCVVCRSINSSWHSVCQRNNCGTRRSADSTVLPYAPWRCLRCGKYSRSLQVPQCEHCGSVRAVVALAAHQNVDGTTEEKRMRRLAEVEALLLAEAAHANDEEKVFDMTSLECTPADGCMSCVEDTLRLALPLG